MGGRERQNKTKIQKQRMEQAAETPKQQTESTTETTKQHMAATAHRWLLRPTQLPMKGQWWSMRSVHVGEMLGV